MSEDRSCPWGGCKGKRSIKSNCGNVDTGAIVPATGPNRASTLLNRVTARVLIGVKIVFNDCDLEMVPD